VAVRLNIDAVAIHLYNPVSHRLQYADGRGFLTTEIEKTNVLIGDYNIGKVALSKQTLLMPTVSSENFPGGNLIKREHFVSYFATPVVAKGQIKGVMELFNRSHFSPDDDWINYFEILAGQTAIAIDNSQLFEGLQRSNFDLSLAYDATIEGWSRAMDLRDRETEGHTLRVTELTIQLARMSGIHEDDILHIRRGSLLHDMGKLGIPDSILHKPGPLTEEEWVLMRKHPTFAYEMLAPIDYLKKAIDIPYCHHERWDGSGYPRGLKGEQIPLAARIFAVVDVYDALTSDRPYRPAWSVKRTLDYIRDESGKHFDPQVVELFFRLMEEKLDQLDT
jgi:HD-GYP domain-containing protein (c-di-GMP phosphodiesterase class II)